MYFLVGWMVVAASWMARTGKLFVFRNAWLGAILIYNILYFGWYFFVPIIFNNGIGYTVQVWNLRPTLNLVLGLVLIQTLVENTDSFNRWLTLAKVMFWTGFGVSVYSVVQWLNIDPLFGRYHFNHINDYFSREVLMVGFLSNKFLTAQYIALLAPLGLMFKGNWYKVAFGFMAVPILLANTVTAVVTYVLGLAVYLLLHRNIKSLVGLGIISLLALVVLTVSYPQFLASSGRQTVWKESFARMMEDKSFLQGEGLGSFPANNIKSGERKALSAHSEPVQVLFEGGAVMIVLVGGYLLDLCRRVLASLAVDPTTLLIVFTSVFVAYVASSFTSFPLRIAPLALIGIIYISALEVLTTNRRFA